MSTACLVLLSLSTLLTFNAYSQELPTLAAERSKITIPAYTAGDRQTVADQAVVLLRDMYVNLDAKKKDFGYDPIPQLLQIQKNAATMADGEFHDQLNTLFNGLRDYQHTKYYYPRPRFCYESDLSVYFDYYYAAGGERKVGVTGIDASRAARIPDLTKITLGDTLIEFSGRDPQLVLAELGHTEPGSNPGSQERRGLFILSDRPHKWVAVPLNDFEDLKLQRPDGSQYSVRVPWLEVIPGNCLSASEEPARARMNPARDELKNPRAGHFSHLSATKARSSTGGVLAPQVPVAVVLQTPVVIAEPADLSNMIDTQIDVVHYKTVRNAWGNFGVIRITMFQADGNVTIDSVVRGLVQKELKDTDGLIFDVRGNPGGWLNEGEMLLQYFSAKKIETLDFQLRTTQANLAFLKTTWPEDEFSGLLEKAKAAGLPYSYLGKITSVADANSTGRIYNKPVAVLTDGGCYSTCDAFSAGMQDAGLAELWSADERTGGGGANVIHQNEFLAWSNANPPLDENGKHLFVKLPGGQDMKIAWRRAVRIGPHAGQLIEDAGVVVEHRLRPSQNDLAHYDTDTLALITADLMKGRKPNQ